MDISMIDFSGLAMALLIALFGMFCHWMKKKVRGEIADGFFEYMLMHEKGSSASAIVVVMTSVVFAFLEGTDPMTHAGAMALFSAGFLGDSILNKPGVIKVDYAGRFE